MVLDKWGLIHAAGQVECHKLTDDGGWHHVLLGRVLPCCAQGLRQELSFPSSGSSITKCPRMWPEGKVYNASGYKACGASLLSDFDVVLGVQRIPIWRHVLVSPHEFVTVT